MKIMTILGTRPEVIRLSRVIPRLDRACKHVLVHTGQNYERSLHDIFFEELGVREPDYMFASKAETAMKQIGKILAECERAMLKEKPDRVLFLGDTNSALAALAAKRMGIPVFHMEAGNRCYDDRVPEEINRRVIDHASDILMPYTERSRANLLREGIAGERIFVTGNPILEVIEHYEDRINASRVLDRLGLKAGEYFLVTMHRAENVDQKDRLLQFLDAFRKLHAKYRVPVICSLHPRTRHQLQKQKRLFGGKGLHAFEPFGLFDFIHLEKNALCVLTDSGTVQEECCIFGMRNVTIRDVTERPETIEAGSNILSGADPASVVACVKTVLQLPAAWTPPAEYLATDVSRTVVKIVTGYYRQ